MALPTRFGFNSVPISNAFVGGYPPMQQLNLVPVMPMQSTAYINLIPTPPASILTSVGMRHHPPRPMRREPPPEKPPITTAFVGNINDKASNDLVKAILQKLGNVANWRRVQGSNGKYQAFGFCEFEQPESTLRALRILHDLPLGNKKLVVKVDDKTKRILNEWFNKQRTRQGKPVVLVDGEIPEADVETKKEDEFYRRQLEVIVQQHSAELDKADEEPPADKYLVKRGNMGEIAMDTNSREYIEREIKQFRATYKDDNEKKRYEQRDRDRDRNRDAHRSREDRRDRDRERDSQLNASQDKENADSAASPRRRRRSGSQEGASVSSFDSARKRRRSEEKSRSPSVRSRSRDRMPMPRSSMSPSERGRSPSRVAAGSSDEEMDREEHERKRLERKLREKEASYQERVRKWESRERRKQREREKEKKKEKAKRQEDLKEAKKLREFLEDYEDERDDPKYYKGSAYAARRREYEKEKEADARDRKKELDEIDEIRQKLLAEGHKNPDAEIKKLQKEQEQTISHMLGDSEASSPASAELRKNDESDGGSPPGSPVDEESRPSSEAMFKPLEVAASESARPIGFTGIKLGGAQPAPSTSTAPLPTLKTVFADDEESEEQIQQRKLVPLDYTDDEKRPVTGDEKKKIIKQLIERIPTTKDELFAHAIEWSFVDETLLNKRLRPWVTKKIVEYIGEEEPSLVDFVCKKIMKQSAPQNLLEDIHMILEEEAEVFVVKMWRLLIYEIEAKKRGLFKGDQ